MVQEDFGRLDDMQLAQLDLPLRSSPALGLVLTTIGVGCCGASVVYNSFFRRAPAPQSSAA